MTRDIAGTAPGADGTDGTDGAPALHRTLSIWEAIGVSVALMAPSMAVNINPQGIASSVGRAVPLAFALATVSVLLICWTFVRLCQRFHHAGSVYGFVGATLGARAGIFAGWALVGTYLFYAVVTSTAAGRFVTEELVSTGMWQDAPESSANAFALIALLVVLLLATREARSGTRLLLVIETVTVSLIVLVAVVVLVKVSGGDGPHGRGFDLSVFSLPKGLGASTVFLGVVFGLLSFAGFESSATLGEEARNPRRDIPRAILGTAIFGGVFFVVVTAIEMMGFGTDKAGVTRFVGSSSLLADLSTQYLAGWVGHVITWGATISALGCALASVVAASRLIFALSRDGVGVPALAQVDRRHGIPLRAVATAAAAAAVIILVAWLGLGAKPFDVFLYSGTIGTLILLVPYILATIGAIILYFSTRGVSAGGGVRVRRWEVVIPVVAIVVLGYTLFRNIYPFPTGAAWWGPLPALAWLVGVLALLFLRPAAAREAGRRLTLSEGLVAAAEPPGAMPADRS